MKRLLVVAVVLGLALPAYAAKPASFEWTTGFVQRSRVVEQQSPGGAFCEVDCVVNPTDFCPWDPDESIAVRGFGVIEPGESFTIPFCVIADWQDHLAYVSAGAGRQGSLTVTITATNPHRSGSVEASGSAVLMCLFTPEYQKFSPLLTNVIPGSNGGVGEYTTVTIQVTNTGTRRIRDASVIGGLQYPQQVSTQALYCGPDIECVGLGVIGQEPKVCWGVAQQG